MGFAVLGWRDVPVDISSLGFSSRDVMPRIQQLFLTKPAGISNTLDFERRLYLFRKKIEKTMMDKDESDEGYCYFVSLSCRTIVYKGMLTALQLKPFYLDLAHPSFESALALVHSRFSTNTFPTWVRAHPYRYLTHNGEINTLRGNINWMHAREALLSSDLFGEDFKEILPIINPNGSDSAMFDNCLEFLP